MSALTVTKPSFTIHEPDQLIVPLRAAVKTYVLNDLDTATHPSYGPVQATARVCANSGRPGAVSVLSAPATLTTSGISSNVTDENNEETDLSL
jgi:hypothetical protein